MICAIEWFARNHVAANLLMVLLVVGGLFMMPKIKQEVIPDINLETVTVSVAYPGASPQEIEEAICIRVEEELHGLQGVKRIRSTAAEGLGSIHVELLAGEDVRKRVEDIRTRIDAIDSFPEESETPVVRQMEIRRPVVNVAVSGHIDEWTLKRLAERARDELSRLPSITDLELAAVRPYEISIEVSEEALRRHGLRFDDVVAAVQGSSLDLPAGSVRTPSGEILLRTKSQAYSGAEFERVAVMTRSDGTRVTLGEVARVVDGFRETDQASRFDGAPTAHVMVFRVGNQSALEISEAVHDWVGRFQTQLPAGVHVTAWQDDARFLRARLDTLLGNARSGFFLVALVLALFLRLRLAFWVSLGIPIAFLGAMATMPALDVSINVISLLGFIVVLGIVVDDAIVVGENTHTEQTRLRDRLRGAIQGVEGVYTPVVFGVLTTMAAFAPMLFMPGPMGRMARVIPIIVIVCLLFSLVEALFVLPAHLSSGAGTDAAPSHEIGRRWRRLQERIAAGLSHVIENVYRPALERTLEWRYLTLASAFALLMVTGGMLFGGWLPFVFQPEVEGDLLVADLTMSPGTPSSRTEEVVRHIEAAAERVRRSVDAARDPEDGSIFVHVMGSVAEQPFKSAMQQVPGAGGGRRLTSGSHLGEVQIQAVDSELRDESLTELTRRWREEVGEPAGVVELTFTSSVVSAGAPIALELEGSELGSLRRAAAHLKRRIAAYPGVFDLADSFRGGKQELELGILPSAESLGLTAAELAGQVRQAFHGEEIQHVQRGRDDVRVTVRYPASERRSLADVERMFIRTRDGAEVPFSSVAEARLGAGFSTIRRVDRQRVVSVSANVDTGVANANEIVADLEETVLPDLMAAYPDVQVAFEGEQKEQRDFLAALSWAQLLALFAIYGLLAVPLRSYVQPLIIMTAIPFGLVGAAWGHVLLGHPFSMFSVIGLVALSGVVVNASLVLVDYVNRRRQEGSSLVRAVREAASARFRPILLTSLTTFAGLTPLMLETSVQAQFLIPMAISLAFGVLFASAITLFIVPASYLVLEDLRGLGARRLPEIDLMAEDLEALSEEEKEDVPWQGKRRPPKRTSPTTRRRRTR